MTKWDIGDRFTNPSGVFEHNPDDELTFVPHRLPPAFTHDDEMTMLLWRAVDKIGELRGRGTDLPNPHLLVRACLKREAVSSSKIEGTHASLDDLNKYEIIGGDMGNVEFKRLRMREVVNYVNALENSLTQIQNNYQNIDLGLMKTAHKQLLQKVRGADESPGHFRKQQVYVIKGNTEIIYTPPPVKRLPELLVNLEKYMQNTDSNLSPLIQCAIAHYQFETIHPFNDGNGRIGRLIIPLILYKRNVLPRPILYLSEYLEKYTEQYYDGLTAVREKSEWGEWIKFFLIAFAEQADTTLSDIEKLSILRQKYKNIFEKQYVILDLIEQLFSNPYMTISIAQKYLDTTYPTAKTIVSKLVDAGILRQEESNKKEKLFFANEIDEVLQSNENPTMRHV